MRIQFVQDMIDFLRRKDKRPKVEELSPELKHQAQQLWQILEPQTVVGQTLIRIGNDYDGGYLMLDDFAENKIAYSFGISTDVSWDLHMAERNIQVFMYDHTISGLPQEHENFHFFRLGIAGEDTDSCKTLDTFIKENNHSAQTAMLLKMDVEGAEWDALLHTPKATLEQFSQITIELHTVNALADGEHVHNMFTVLKKLNETHQVIHVHANNCCGIVTCAGIILPNVLEVTYVRKKDFTFTPCTHSFPISLDMPNIQGRDEIILGTPWKGA